MHPADARMIEPAHDLVLTDDPLETVVVVRGAPNGMLQGP
jgi:hypothetical protein